MPLLCINIIALRLSRNLDQSPPPTMTRRDRFDFAPICEPTSTGSHLKLKVFMRLIMGSKAKETDGPLKYCPRLMKCCLLFLKGWNLVLKSFFAFLSEDFFTANGGLKSTFAARKFIFRQIFAAVFD